MDAKIYDLTVASTSIRADIAGFRETATDLDRRLSIVENQVAVLPDQETELRSLCAKVTDLEDRSRRDNVIRGLVFSPPLEFQRAHRIGSLHEATPDKPRPIIVGCLRHEQARQVFSAAKSRGPFF
ncbi:hypothetical protein NDU88_005177 [Pleurodeles waltl]|uniref:Uncharacterized protein n=1 Tax=Pleurodeles waltl TaxID=8319 RepID=A0AAV7TA90_PLEWA|nr:hypothetical protein NDU88_005177 [Pleurodeles waltl]